MYFQPTPTGFRVAPGVIMTFPTQSRPRRTVTASARRDARVVSGAGKALLAASGAVLAISIAACGGGAASGPANASDAPANAEAETRSYPRNRISRVEILERGDNANTAMEVVRRLRPAWLLSRGADPVVYVDNVRRPGGVDALFSVPVGQIRLLEFIGAADATTRWGTGHTGGVIQVVTGG